MTDIDKHSKNIVPVVKIVICLIGFYIPGRPGSTTTPPTAPRVTTPIDCSCPANGSQRPLTTLGMIILIFSFLFLWE